MVCELCWVNWGGWYVLRNWNTDDFDRRIVLKNLQVKYGVSPFFRISVVADPYTSNENIIRISPAGLGLPDREYYYKEQDDRIQKAYKELITDVVKELGSTRNEAEKFGNDIFFYEKRIAEITPTLQNLSNPMNTYNIIKLSELKDTVSTIPFLDILIDMFREVNINESTGVVVTSQEYLSQVSEIISSTDQKTMNGYLIWTLVRHYLPYLSNSYISSLNNFNAELYGVQQPPKRWEFCASLVRNFMGYAVDALDYNSNPITEKTRLLLENIYQTILKTVKDDLQKFKNRQLLYSQLMQKLNTLRLQIGLPNNVTHSTFLKTYFNKLKIIKANFFESIRYTMEFERKTQEMRLLNPSENYRIISMTGTIPEVVYSPSENLVFIPKSLLSPPYFEDDYPISLIFGRVGVELAEAVVSSVLPYNSFWIHIPRLLTHHHTSVKESLDSVSEMRRCLRKYISNLVVSEDTANETALATLRRISAIKLANKALTKYIANRDHIHQPTLEEFEDTAVFYLSYAQTQCAQSTTQYQMYNNLVNFKLPQRSSLLVEWGQLSEFSEAFDCSSNGQCPQVF